ncbi:hypothetical protein AURDEDRAFT_158916 [Auricularia subglabra TFB-10046 SS5]|nr:hypothetical protein AURDEDRAFT_158916 [Auricularia subglabra TFB-10046 SS5]
MAENKARPSPRKELDLAEKMIAYQRRDAAASASRPRAPRPSQVPVQERADPAMPDPEDFSRRLKILSGRTRELYRPDPPRPHPTPTAPTPSSARPGLGMHSPHSTDSSSIPPARDEPLRFAKSQQRAQQQQPQPQPSRQQQQLKFFASRHIAVCLSVSSASVSSAPSGCTTRCASRWRSRACPPASRVSSRTSKRTLPFRVPHAGEDGDGLLMFEDGASVTVDAQQAMAFLCARTHVGHGERYVRDGMMTVEALRALLDDKHEDKPDPSASP